jgi:hypothetical protein
MSEIFTIVCRNVAVAAAQDILAAYAGASYKLELLAVEMDANGQTVVGNYPISVKYLGSTVTAGSGGSTPTPANADSTGVASSGFTAHANDTTPASSSTTHYLHAAQFNPINGWYWEPPGKGEPPLCDLSGAFVLSLDGAPAASINVSATMWLRRR